MKLLAPSRRYWAEDMLRAGSLNMWPSEREWRRRDGRTLLGAARRLHLEMGGTSAERNRLYLCAYALATRAERGVR